MYHNENMDGADYTHYYLEQSGNGLSDIGRIYRRKRFYQNGRGIGSLFGGIMKSLRPIFKSSVKALGKQSYRVGKDMMKNFGKRPFKDLIKENGKLMLNNLAEQSVDQIQQFNNFKKMSNNINGFDASEMEGQYGNGTSLSFPFKSKRNAFKRKTTSKPAQSKKRVKRVKRKDIFS